jgi:Flp pilus assembly protein TadD
MQDVSGLSSVFQNFGQQQANQQAALAQQGQLAQQAGQSQGGGMNPMALALMLRAKDLKKPNDGITERSTGVAYDQNGQNPYAYTPQEPDYSNVGNVFSTRD